MCLNVCFIFFIFKIPMLACKILKQQIKLIINTIILHLIILFQDESHVSSFHLCFVWTILNLTMLFFLLQFINHLVNQLARHRFLKIACQMERRTILGAYSLVKVIESELEGYLSAGNGRLVCKNMFTVFSMICTCPSFYSVSVT